MATIKATSNEKVISIKAFLGLNECPDGENKLKMGEASVCKNFKITKDGDLKKRAGTAEIADLRGEPPYHIGNHGLWHGWVRERELLLTAYGGKLFSMYDDINDVFYEIPLVFGNIDTFDDVTFIPFENKLYLLNGIDYMCLDYYGNAWHLDNYSDGKHGYRPLVSITVPPAGGGTSLEQVNKLNGMRRLWISPDGKFATFQLPEKDIVSVDWVKDLKTQTNLTPTTDYTVDLVNGTVSFIVPASETFIGKNNSEKFEGDGTTKKFYLKGDVDDIVTVKVDGETMTVDEDYTVDSERDRITFTTAPADEAKIVVDLGNQKTFKLLNAIIQINTVTVGGTETQAYTYDSEKNEITLTTAPAIDATIVVSENIAPLQTVNSFEIAWTVDSNFAETVAQMKYAELYAGTQDTRIFAYGNGTNEAFYTGIDYDGTPRGDYWPDLYEIVVGDKNTPLMGMIRHYSNLMAFKKNSTYSIDYGITTLADELMTPAFYASPVNRILGSDILGQVQLVLSAPRTISGGNLYEWRNNSSYASNLSADERQAKRISDRISTTLKSFDIPNCHCYDDNINSEYWIINSDGNALVHNYIADAWYYYEGLYIDRVVEFHGKVYIANKYGFIVEMSEEYTSDTLNGVAKSIDCRWESGAMDFGASYMRKYSAQMWIGMKPELDNEVMVTVETDRSSENTVVSVEPELKTELPQMKRGKVKVKKFVFAKLIFWSSNMFSRCTIVDTEMRVRYTSYSK